MASCSKDISVLLLTAKVSYGACEKFTDIVNLYVRDVAETYLCLLPIYTCSYIMVQDAYIGCLHAFFYFLIVVFVSYN